MTCLLLAVLLTAPGEPSLSSPPPGLVAEATEASPTRSTAAEGLRESVEPRRFHEINVDLRDQIRGYARAETRAEQAGWTRQMCVLYLELKRDPRLATSDTLKSYKAKLWSVLQRIQLDIAQQESREQRQQGQQGPQGQHGQMGARLAQQQTARSGQPSADQASEPPIAAEASDSLAGSLSLLGGLLGGPGDLLANGGSFAGGPIGGGAFGGGAAGGDYGPALVELIQRTIAPEFWDVNGGPGTIVYYAPLRVLVVRATSEMHHDVGAAVGAVRRAGQ